ncbi:hypothetical protein TNIN_326271 [Trichonephila inaurata madagascariensis]|uniref:Uncharacterized protein n=1 Tax=Trichonephila inaurata madagascariensis TaxID=2747483 RepID=A0A8X7BMN8_9ARAC|nr:hypothetical protein TNIN_326271 [Trichonephila inaurata madagascariensis]
MAKGGLCGTGEQSLPLPGTNENHLPAVPGLACPMMLHGLFKDATTPHFSQNILKISDIGNRNCNRRRMWNVSCCWDPTFPRHCFVTYPGGS